MERKQLWMTILVSVVASTITTSATVRWWILPMTLMPGIFSGSHGHSWSLSGEPYHIIVCFEDVQGIPEGAPVRLSGVKIGEVIQVGLEDYHQFPDRPAYVRLAIGRRFDLFRDDKFEVALSPPLGDRYIRVTRGSRRQEELDPEKLEVIRGSDTFDPGHFAPYPEFRRGTPGY